MRLGLLISGRRNAREAVALARSVESEGLDEVWISEDYLDRGAFAVAGGVAAATESVTVGIGVINQWTRHPALSAMEIAGLDEISGGRAVLGLGTSNRVWMHDRLGLPYVEPLKTLIGMTESVRSLIGTGSLKGSDGQHDVDVELSFTPHRPDIPIVWGVKREEALKSAGVHADGVLLGLLSSPEYARWVRDLIPDSPLYAYVGVCCDRDAGRARDALRPIVAKYLGAHGRNVVTQHAGVEPELAGLLRQAWVEGRDASSLVTDDILNRVVIAGDPDDCREGIERYRAAGLKSLIVLDDPDRDAEATWRFLVAT